MSMHRGQLGDDHLVVAGSVWRDLAAALPEEVRRLAVKNPVLRAITVEYSARWGAFTARQRTWADSMSF